MFKLFLLACMLALVTAEPKPKPDPAAYYGAYTAPVAPAYTAPYAYSAYTAPFGAYSAYPYASPYSYYGF